METRLAALAVADVSSTLERRGSWSDRRRIPAVVTGRHGAGSLPSIWLRIVGSDYHGEPYPREVIESAACEIGARIYRNAFRDLDPSRIFAVALRTRELGLNGWWRVLDTQAGAVWWLPAPGDCRTRVRAAVAACYPGDPSHGRRVALTARQASYL